MDLRTCIPYPCGMEGLALDFNHKLYCVSIDMYNGATGGGVSANALDSPAQTTMLLFPADII